MTSSISAKNKYGYFYAWSDRRKIAIDISDSKFSFYCKKRAIRSAVTAYGLNTVENVLLPQQINHIKQYCLIEKESYGLSRVGFREKILCYGVLKCEPICKIYGKMMFLFERVKRFLK